MSDFLAKIIAQLDMNQANSDMNAFLNKNRKVKVKVDLDTGNVNINNLLNQIKLQFNQAGNVVGANFAKNVNASLNSIDVSRTKFEIDKLKNALQNFGFNANSIDNITRELDNLKVTVTDITHSLNGSRLDVTVKGVDSLDRTVTSIQSFNVSSGDLISQSSRVSQSFKQMFTDADASKLSASIAALDANFVKLKGNISSESAELQKLKTDLSEIGNISGLENQQAEFERITQRVNELSVAYKQAKAEMTSAAAAQQLLTGKTVLGNEITTWMTRNTKAAKVYETQLRSLQEQLKSVTNSSQLRNLTNEFNQIKTTAAAEGNLGKSVWSQLIGNITKLSPLFGMGQMIRMSINSVKSMVSSVYELDTALVDLQKTTTASYSELNSFYEEANNIAKEYGATTKDIIQSAADWSRLGYSLKDSELMSKYSSLFKSISPGMSAETANTGLVSIMKAYGIDASNVLDDVISKINIIGNTAATSNDQIVTGLEKSSAAMALMGSTLEENIALFTAGQEIIQNDSQVGNALRSISMRIRGYDEETEQLSEDLVNIKGDVIDLTKTVDSPNGISLFTDETQTQYKSVYTYLQEISQIYDKLGAKQQQNLLEKLFGKNRASVGAAILENFSAAEKAMENMGKSAGSAEKEMETIKNSLEYKINALKETGVGIAQNLFQRDDMKAVVDTLTDVLSVVEKLTDSLGLLGSTIVGIGIAKTIKSITWPKITGDKTICMIAEVLAVEKLLKMVIMTSP